MRDSLFNTCGMKMRKLLDKKSEVFAQKYGVRNVELRFFYFYIIRHVVIQQKILWRRRIYPKHTFQSL